MRIIFMGSPEFSSNILKQLHKDGHEICAVYAQPPKPAGRGYKLKACAVHQAAEELDLPVFTPKNFKNSEDIKIFEQHKADLAIVVAYGLILPQAILDAPLKGCVNIHASILPRWRGAAPIQRAIESGDKETGLTFMQMDKGLDTGDMLKFYGCSIESYETAGMLHDKLSLLAAQNITSFLAEFEAGKLPPVKQPEEGVIYAHKLSKAESLVDWNMDGQDILKKLYAFTPWPGLFFMHDDVRIRILEAQYIEKSGPAGLVDDDRLTVCCAKGALQITKLQKAGKKPMKSEDFLRGSPIVAGTQLL